MGHKALVGALADCEVVSFNERGLANYRIPIHTFPVTEYFGAFLLKTEQVKVTSHNPKHTGSALAAKGNMFTACATMLRAPFPSHRKNPEQALQRQLGKLKGRKGLDTRFKLAMMLMSQSLLADGRVNSQRFNKQFEQGFTLLQEVADEQHPAAMHILGTRYYLANRVDSKLGLDYVSKAAQYNFAPAEYRLGTFLLDYPVVKKDEKKALFWFESAAEKNLLPAQLKAAELLLTAEDQSLHDIEKAAYWLEQVQMKYKRHPQYLYLLALTHKNREQPEWKQFFNKLMMAIHEGPRQGWDVTEWQALYDKYINGKITIEDEAA